MTIPRMRTITETIAEIKAIDPMTAVTRISRCRSRKDKHHD